MNQYVPNSDIFTVDALYHEAEMVSIHLIKSDDRIAIVDTGTHHSVAQIEQALTALKLNFSHVDYIILTHIHLDHAGGASALMQLCENAQLIVHPKGARHMADPAKLIAGTIAVYGEAAFKKLYGDISPIEPNRIIEPSDGQTIEFANRSLTFIDTPGHANHHHCIIDTRTNSAFTGDTLGVGYRALRDDNNAFLFTTTTPVQFNPDALHVSINKVMDYQPEHLYLTHYSAVKPTAQMIAGLHEQIDDLVMITQQCAEADNAFETQLEQQVFDYLVRRCANELPNLDQQKIEHWIKFDAKLNAQGLAFWWQHKR